MDAVANTISAGPANTGSNKTRAKRARSKGPSLQISEQLNESYDLFNQELFDGRLPLVWLGLINKPGCYGYFKPNQWENREGVVVDVIALDSGTATSRPLEELLSTLVHEMAHASVFHCSNGRASTGGHGRAWRAEMKRLGLPPLRIGRTWDHATHSIDPNGAFHAAFLKHRKRLQELPWRECVRAAAKGTDKRDRARFQCPLCTFNAWARPTGRLFCGFCTTPEGLVGMLSDEGPAPSPSPGGTSGAKAPRTHYPEPRGAVSLPPWTDEIGRELRLHTGIDHPPQDIGDALIVLTFGVKQRRPELAQNLPRALESKDQDAIAKALREVWIHRCQVLHPDVEGGSEIAFKALQTAHSMVRPPRRAKPSDSETAGGD